MIKAIKGTKDILPSDISRWKYIEQWIHEKMQSFNYSEIKTPIFEETALFNRGIGEATDIVSKEMYTLTYTEENSGGKPSSLTLRPEMTASVVRAFIEHSLSARQELNKLYYIGPMFRKERPQAGRLRQFHQFGAEALGSPSARLDTEMIILAYDILKAIGLKDLSVKINSLGVPSSREAYKGILREYLSDKLELLSEDSRNRFETNILRIFDSKVTTDQNVMAGAPLLIDYLDEESLRHFDTVRNLLDCASVPYEIDTKLVRGLDYYTKTTFEIASGSVGSQSALCGGGRYDLLIEQLGGKPTPGVGFAAGIERILLACENENIITVPEERLDLFIIRLDKDLSQKVFETGLFFRRKNISAEFDYFDRSVKAQMREANRLNAKYTLFVGGQEYSQGQLVLKNMQDGTQENIDIDKLDLIYNKVSGGK